MKTVKTRYSRYYPINKAVNSAQFLVDLYLNMLIFYHSLTEYGGGMNMKINQNHNILLFVQMFHKWEGYDTIIC